MKLLKRLVTLGDPLFWELFIAVMLVFSVAWFAVAARATTERRKDIIFVGPFPHCLGDAVECASSLHFNGEWRGVRLCHAGRCVAFEDIKFTEVWDAKRN